MLEKQVQSIVFQMTYFRLYVHSKHGDYGYTSPNKQQINIYLYAIETSRVDDHAQLVAHYQLTATA